MTYYTLEEAANILSKSKGYLTSIVRTLPHFYKTEIECEQKGNFGRNVKVHRKMWVIDKEDMEDIKNYFVKPPKDKNNSLAWTRSSLECYKARLMCNKCPNCQVCKDIEAYTHSKPIKQKTIELVKEYGIPPERMIDD